MKDARYYTVILIANERTLATPFEKRPFLKPPFGASSMSVMGIFRQQPLNSQSASVEYMEVGT